jgi:hypothetical protein
VFLPLENPNSQAVFFPKTDQFSQVKKVLDALASNLDGFLLRCTYVFFNSAE